MVILNALGYLYLVQLNIIKYIHWYVIIIIVTTAEHTAVVTIDKVLIFQCKFLYRMDKQYTPSLIETGLL